MDTSARLGSETPLRKVRVLVTRAAGDALALRLRLEQMGALVFELPAVDFEPPADTGPLDAALRRLKSYDWIVFASRKAVMAVWDRLGYLGISPSLLGKIAAVGPSTARELETRGTAVSCVPSDGTASALARALAEEGLAGKRVLLPAGDLARPELPSSLRAAGAEVDEIVVYRTTQPLEVRRASLDALRRGTVDVVTLASPSAIRNLARMLGADISPLQNVAIVCIGPTTAAAVRELGLQPAAEAREHTVDGLVQAVTDLYSTEAAS